MSYYLQDNDSTLNGYPQVSDLFPDGVQTKSELVDFLDEAFAEVKNDPEIGGVVNWVSYWTGFNAGAGTVYALSTEYANQIGYNGPTTAKTQNFILVLDKYIEQNVRDLMAKSKSTTKSLTDYRKTATFHLVTEEIEYIVNCMGEDIRRFDTDGGRFSSIADYKQQVKDDTDQIFRAIERLENVEVNGDEYALRESAKKSKSFSDMVKSQRAKNIRKRTGPEITASMDLLEDIAYLADACSMEAKSVADGIYEKSPSEIGFKCSPEEFKQKVLECKQLADWLVDNIELWSFY